MNNGPRNTMTLKRKHLFSILAIVVLQLCITILIISLSGTSRQLDESAENTLQNVVDFKKNSLEVQMSQWTDLERSMGAIEEYVQKLEIQQEESAAVLFQDNAVRKEILKDLSDVLLQNLRDTKATGSFLILEGKSGSSNKSALYLRDLDPDNTPNNNYDILVEAGGGHDILEKGFALDSEWSLELPISSDSDFFHMPINAARENRTADNNDLGYLSSAFRLRENDIEIITYTIPLLDRNNAPYGVLGIEISLDQFRSFIPSQEIAVDKDAAYMLGIREDDFIKPVIIDGDYYRARIGNNKIQLKQIEDSFFSTVIETEEVENTVVYETKMRMYNSNTPFENQQWMLMGLVHKDVFYQSSQRLSAAFIVTIILALIVSVVGAVFITSITLQPIQRLMVSMQNRTEFHLKLPKTGITEIDELAAEIERLNEHTFRAGSKVANIIETTKLPLGVFEIIQGSENVFCTKQVFEMLGIFPKGWENNCIGIDEFRKEMERIRQYFSDEEKEEGIFRFHTDSGEKYLQYKFSGDENRGLHILMDVTQDVREKQKIKRDRDYDVLTNLYNRRAFTREVTARLENKSCNGALLAVWDLDNLKYVNDTYGHDMGDKYICLLADIFMSMGTERLITARMSGDEYMLFTYLKNREDNEKRIVEIHKKFLSSKLSLPDGSLMSVSASAGTAKYGEDAIVYPELVKYADFAMYEAKKKEKGTIREFYKDSYIKDYILVQGVGELHRILEEEDIQYAFQPIFDIKEGRIFAYEALMRPQSQILMNPELLLKIAATQSKLKQVEILTWFHALNSFFSICQDNTTKVFLNSIADQCLTDEEFLRLEEQFGNKMSRVVMEMTEEQQTDENYQTQKMNWCNRWEAKVALDDFGTGYSNLEFLGSRELDFVKLDRSLIQDIHMRPSVQRLVSSVVEYCHEKGVSVIAEGVELKEEFQQVAGLNIDYVQGYYLAKPAFELIEISEQIEKILN